MSTEHCAACKDWVLTYEMVRTERDDADAQAARLAALVDRLADKIARVETLSDDWAAGRRPVHWRGFVADVRAALDGPQGSPK